MALSAQELMFSKTISLEPDDNRFQLVYATQLYGTLFGAFARFQTAKSGANIKIKQIDFYGINYKGSINLGIRDLFINDIENDVLKIDLTLQADDTAIYTKEIKKENLNILITPNQALEIDRTLVPMNDDMTLPDEHRAFKHGKFDSEFFVRDGLYVKAKSTNPNNEFKHMDPISINTSTPQGIPAGLAGIGVICRIGAARFFFD